MPNLEHRIQQARFRLNINVLLSKLGMALVVSSAAWGLYWIIQRTFAFPFPAALSIGAAVGLAATITGVMTFLARRDALAAALRIDQAAGLKERLSSAFTLSRSSDPYAIAAVSDAERRAAGIHVPTHIPIQAPHTWPWSVATLLVAGLLFAFMPQLNLFANEEKKQDPLALERAAGEKVAVKQAFSEEMNKVRKLVEDTPGLADLKDDLKAMDIPDDPGAKPEDVRRDVLKKLDKVADQLSEKRDSMQLKTMEEIKKELAKIEPKQGKDPTSKLSQALAQGSTEEAKKAIDDLKKELEEAAEKGDPESKQKMQEMAQKLDDLSKKMKELGDQQKTQKELENKAGLNEEQAKKMLEELAKMDPKQLEKELQKRLGDKSGMNAEQIKEMAKKLAQNQEAKKQMQEMAKKLAQAAQQCQKACDNPGQNGQKSGDAQAAADALSQAADQLSEMEMAEQMANELDAQLNDLKNMREGMCQGNGQRQGTNPSDEIGNQGPNEGLGYGSRIGKEAGAHKYKSVRAEVRAQNGQIIGQLLIDGPQIKGQAAAEVKNAVNAAVRDATDAVEHDRVPRQYHDVTKHYFEELARLANQSSNAQPSGGDKPKPSEK